MSKPHVILVHGAYHRAWHLGLLKNELEKSGYEVSTPELPSVGADHPNPAAMSADAQVIKSAIENAASVSDGVLPVFHSYAGICGSEAVAQLSDPAKKNINRIIYLAAFVVPEGKGCVPNGIPPPPWGAETEDKIWRIVPDPVVPFYHDVEPELAKEAASRCLPQLLSALTEETRFAGWRMFPTTYIFCDDDRAIPPAMQKRFFDVMSEEDRRGWEFETSEGSHSPFLADPAKCARLIRKIAGEEIRGEVITDLNVTRLEDGADVK